MRLLDRYLLRELLIPLGYCLCGFLIFWIAFDLIGQLNHYQKNQLDFSDVLELYTVKIPEILVLILPIALLLALLYTLTNHARHHELTAIRAAGVSLWRICIPYLAVGLLLSFALFAMNEFWVPDSTDKEEQILNRHMGKKADEVSLEVINKLAFDNARDSRDWLMQSYNLRTHTMIAPQVHWKLPDGTRRLLLAERAERINDVWTFFGSSFFSANDITNLPALAARLKKPAHNDGVSQYLAAQLSAASQYLLANANHNTNAEIQKFLLEDLNRVIQIGPVYEAKRFAGVKISPDAAGLITEELHGTNLIWLNRALLLDAYPQEMSRSHSYTVVEYSDDNSRYDPLLQTNLLAMPEFSETPEQFKREIKFDSRFKGTALAESAEIPMLEIIDYLRLHPDLKGKKKWLLATQLQGRLAAPWTCVVVVLIAIPFGAASGRRSVFVGVAGSIVICFVYFVLLKLGLAAGTGGYLPAWAAAWLPNATFGITGFWMMLRVR